MLSARALGSALLLVQVARVSRCLRGMRLANEQPISISLSYVLQPLDVRRPDRYFRIDVGEQGRSPATFAGHRNHLAATLAESKPMHCSRRQVNQGARLGGHGLFIDTEFDVATDHIKGFIPRM